MAELDELYARQEVLESANESLKDAFRGVDGDAHTALEVARQNARLMTALRATQIEHGRVIAGLVTEVAGVKAEVAGVKAEVAGVKAEVAGVKAEVAEVKADVAEVKAKVGVVDGGVAELKAGLAEVLRRLPG